MRRVLRFAASLLELLVILVFWVVAVIWGIARRLSHAHSYRTLTAIAPLAACIAVVIVGVLLWLPSGGDPDRDSDLGSALLAGAFVGLVLVWLQRRGEASTERQGLRLELSVQQDLSNIDLTGRNLSGFHLRGKNMRQARLDDADLSIAYLRDCNLRSASLVNANLRDALLIGADLRGANLDVADLRGARLMWCDLRRATLNSADLGDANFGGSFFSDSGTADAIRQLGHSGTVDVVDHMEDIPPETSGRYPPED